MGLGAFTAVRLIKLARSKASSAPEFRGFTLLPSSRHLWTKPSFAQRARKGLSALLPIEPNRQGSKVKRWRARGRTGVRGFHLVTLYSASADQRLCSGRMGLRVSPCQGSGEKSD